MAKIIQQLLKNTTFKMQKIFISYVIGATAEDLLVFVILWWFNFTTRHVLLFYYLVVM